MREYLKRNVLYALDMQVSYNNHTLCRNYNVNEPHLTIFQNVDEDLIYGKCAHVYHRDCIMKWMYEGHEECPECRELLWDPETYKRIETSARVTPSAPFFG